ncbi:DUF480 domain-containing protein [Sphingobacterium sp. SRCM116780]|nr:YceH family protein [Sphingobacterium sp. SRCM116780]UIR58010.1 DUF480 domain-containing protein [Sphingobacterium sp. SRCM116780]
MEPISIPQLSAEEQRILGALIEKSRTTPEYYPMSLNGLQSACNQKTARRPVVNYSEDTIIKTLDILRKKGLIAHVVGGGSRVTKYKHNFAIQFPLVPSELAIICLLLLRGPLTAGEINSNSGRLYDFDTLEDINEHLEKLASEGFVKALTKQPGHKEIRYIHVLGEINLEQFEQSTTSSENTEQLHKRIETLEQEVSQLKQQLQDLWDELH